MDLIGLDVNFAVTKSIWQAYFNDPRYAPSVRQQELVAAGFLGRKSGRGFYDYTSGATPPEPRCETASTVPPKVAVHGDLGIVAPLADRIAGAGITVERARADSRFPRGALHVSGDGGGAWITLTDGRTATARVAATGVRNLVLVDLALDFASTKRLAVARADTCDDDAYRAAVGALRAAGIAGCRFDDIAALAVMRTVATLANEAADAAMQGVASPAAIDLAMQQGVNYPRGPLAWADALGAALVGDVLFNLAAHYGEDRYRLSPLLARRAATGGTFHG
jgi:3-hydroxybutyryl-CoA dehydrogenase